MGVGLELELEFVEAIELRGEPMLDRLDAQADGQVALADPGRALDQYGLGGTDEGAGGQGVDARALDRRLEREVEVSQCLPSRAWYSASSSVSRTACGAWPSFTASLSTGSS
jgi:hypothetical protein